MQVTGTGTFLRNDPTNCRVFKENTFLPSDFELATGPQFNRSLKEFQSY